MKKTIALSLSLVILMAVAGYFAADYYRSSPDEMNARFIGRETCAQCHQPQMTSFEGSDHDLAMDLANESTVLADFNDQTIEHYGKTSRMFRDGDKFMVNTDGPDGEMRDYEVKYVFGVRPLQQYMVEIDRPEDAKDNEVGRVQVLRISWDTNKKSWFYLMPPDVDEHIESNDPLHWTGITQNWNASCASCHSTNVHKNFTPSIAEYRTTFSEIDVSCEACHGPASYHVELANRQGPFWDRKHGFGLAKLKGKSNVPQVETCAPCHSRRVEINSDFQPGCNFDDYFATQVISDPIYHVDGQVRDEDYVYGSFIQSKMYHNDVRCTDCHDPHTAKVKMTGNTLCTSCHQNQHPAGKYDTPNHHHHEPGQPGSFCVDCHMPATTYMMLDHRRDHSFRVPRPDLSVSLGTPNACSSCHIDESKLADRTSELPLRQYLDWIIAAEQGDDVVKAELDRTNEAMKKAVDDWYAEAPANQRTRYYEQLAIGLSQKPESQELLLKLALDQSAPAMLRASAATGLASDTSEVSLDVAIEALGDSDPKVVAAAILRLDVEIGQIADRLQYAENRGDATAPFKKVASALTPLFSHPSIRVRREAARVFATLAPTTRSQLSSPRQRIDFDKAINELEQSWLIGNDRASAHMMLGGLHEMLQEYEKAKNDYRTAISAERNVAGPRSNLASILDQETNQLRSQMQSMQRQSGGVQAGQMRSVLTDIQSRQQKVAELRAQEHILLENDIRRSQGLPNTHSLHYRYAMSAYLQRDLETTEEHLKLAYEQQPETTTYLVGLAAFYIEKQDPVEALFYIEQLLEQDPNHQGYLNLKKAAIQMKASKPELNLPAPPNDKTKSSEQSTGEPSTADQDKD